MRKGLGYLISGILIMIASIAGDSPKESIGIFCIGIVLIITYILTNKKNIIATGYFALSGISAIGMMEETSFTSIFFSFLLAFMFFAIFFLKKKKERKIQEFKNFFDE